MSADATAPGRAERKRRPLSGEGPVVLRSETDPGWLELALARFDEVLVDHAHCEKKAAANALSLLQMYPDVPTLPAHMARLAREESGHLARVLALLEERGLSLTRDSGDPYAQGLQALLRNPAEERKLDRLLIAAIIEARSCERLGLLARGLPEGPVKRFYQELEQSEDGHQALFYRLAEQVAGSEKARERLSTLLDAEVQILASVGNRPAIH